MANKKKSTPSKKGWGWRDNNIFTKHSVDFWMSATALILSILSLLMKVFAI